ncbi:hypothetical protein [Dechloromonas denitrificans]|uniref:hypothetical protein n=1 Tax=Dechloromonas denitrificans TaxID=281362 RepID=UPI001CF99668|nr:hypothetical protein [Dechloromonas denitrificans]UCV10180.1 hypothetical protein KI615_03115 [Dechloromonas denitrificans]
MQTTLDSPDWFGDTESANHQYFLRKQAKPDKPKGESGFSFLHSCFPPSRVLDNPGSTQAGYQFLDADD